MTLRAVHADPHTDPRTERDHRALALLGEQPLVTLVDANEPETCLSVRLLWAGKAWLGVVDDHAAILDRVRMGLLPRFVGHHSARASAPTVSGSAEVRVIGRADAQTPAADSALARLLAMQAFGCASGVVVEISPRGWTVDSIGSEDRPSGAVPCT